MTRPIPPDKRSASVLCVYQKPRHMVRLNVIFVSETLFVSLGKYSHSLSTCTYRK